MLKTSLIKMSLALGISFISGFWLGTLISRLVKQCVINLYYRAIIDQNNECPICYESIKDKHIVICCKCKKLYDIDCVTNWLNMSVNSSCPCCRNKWFKKHY